VVRLIRIHSAAAVLVTDDRIRHEVAGTRVVPVTLLVLLVALLLVALRARGRVRRAVAVLLLPVSAGWVAFNGRLEGPVLISFSQAHGMTASDLLAVLGVLTSAALLVSELRRRRSASRRRALRRSSGAITDAD
jgi:hypothetical protein